MSRTLVIFDIDGTLVDTHGLHNSLIKGLLGADGLDLDFKPAGTYAHYTDQCVLDELHQHHHARAVTPQELARYDVGYAGVMQSWLDDNILGEIAGAKTLLQQLSNDPAIALAFATGSLRGMAELKLTSLGLDPDHLALATSSEHFTREAIVIDAAIRAEQRSGSADHIVILGDGLWDQRTAENLAIPFVGVETGTYRFGNGPVAVIPDYAQFDVDRLVRHAGPIAPFLEKRTTYQTLAS